MAAPSDERRSSLSRSTSGVGARAGGWACGGEAPGGRAPREASGSKQLSSDDRRLQRESATDGRLPLREGESDSEEFARRCSGSRASEPPPPLLTLLRSFPLLLLSPGPDSLGQRGGEHHSPSCCAAALLQLAPPRLLLPLLRLSFSGFGSTSAWTSKLLSLQHAKLKFK